jgi:hypothetical protein
MARVTKALRSQWLQNLEQSTEELASGVHQDGRPMTENAKSEMAADIELMKHLLATKPVGTQL